MTLHCSILGIRFTMKSVLPYTERSLQQETHDRLKEYYDGYHFIRRNMVDIYNSFSLVRALNEGELGNYWVSK